MKSYRLTRKPQRYWGGRGETQTCKECGSQIKHKRIHENGNKCLKCYQKPVSKLDSKQQTLVKYLMLITKRKSELELKRKLNRNVGGILVDVDEDALVLTILEYRSKRMMKWLGLEDYRLDDSRRKAKKALEMLNRLYTLTFNMQGERIEDIEDIEIGYFCVLDY